MRGWAWVGGAGGGQSFEKQLVPQNMVDERLQWRNKNGWTGR